MNGSLVYLVFCTVGQNPCWPNVKLKQCQVDKMSSLINVEMTICQVDKMSWHHFIEDQAKKVKY